MWAHTFSFGKGKDLAGGRGSDILLPNNLTIEYTATKMYGERISAQAIVLLRRSTPANVILISNHYKTAAII